MNGKTRMHASRHFDIGDPLILTSGNGMLFREEPPPAVVDRSKGHMAAQKVCDSKRPALGFLSTDGVGKDGRH